MSWHLGINFRDIFAQPRAEPHDNRKTHSLCGLTLFAAIALSATATTAQIELQRKTFNPDGAIAAFNEACVVSQQSLSTVASIAKKNLVKVPSKYSRDGYPLLEYYDGTESRPVRGRFGPQLWECQVTIRGSWWPEIKDAILAETSNKGYRRTKLEEKAEDGQTIVAASFTKAGKKFDLIIFNRPRQPVQRNTNSRTLTPAVVGAIWIARP